MGDSGFGKSSLAAALLARGSRLVTDDLMVVDIDDRPRVHPGPRRLKLLPSGARRLLGSDAVGVPVNDRTAKMVIPLGTEQVVAEPVPLVALFALGHPARWSSVSRVTIRRMTQRAAFIELTQNSFNSIVVDHPRLRVQFSTASDVASRVPMFRLSYPPGLGKLGVVHDALLETVASDGRVWGWTLKEQGYRVVIASHRLEATRTTTERWLGQHQLPYDELHLSFDKTVLFDRAAVVVDDAPQTLEKAVAKGVIGAGLLFPWNRSSARNGFGLFKDLSEVLKYILQRQNSGTRK